jgi:uncharacterized membrane protein YqaE (UPF0057 family)
MKKNSLLLFVVALFMGSAIYASEPISKPKAAVDTSTTNEAVLDDVVATDALREFKSLSRVDRKMRIAEAKKAMKEYKAQKASGGDVSTNTLLLVILAILLPPLAVALHEHGINGKFWLDLLLTLLFYLPGLIYALIVILA